MTRTAIVTGAARGLGEAIARRLHADGYRVVLADLDLGEGAEAREHDIRSLGSWEELVAATSNEALWAVVNNAARTEVRSFWDIDPDEWDDVLATNLRGTYLGCRVVGAHLRDRGAGRIVNSRVRRAGRSPACTMRPPRQRSWR